MTNGGRLTGKNIIWRSAERGAMWMDSALRNVLIRCRYTPFMSRNVILDSDYRFWPRLILLLSLCHGNRWVMRMIHGRITLTVHMLYRGRRGVQDALN